MLTSSQVFLRSPMVHLGRFQRFWVEGEIVPCCFWEGKGEFFFSVAAIFCFSSDELAVKQ